MGAAFTGNLVLSVSDDTGKALCRINVPEAAGIARVSWNLRVEAAGGGGGGGGGGGFGGRGGTPPVANGWYTAQLGKLDGDKVTPVGRVQRFQVLPLPAKNW